MKFTRKLIPALAMLVVSATMMSTASFAWFSMNRTVTAKGMQATAVAPVNVLISNAASGTYANEVAVTTNPTGKLNPMSANATTILTPANCFALEDGSIVGSAGEGGPIDGPTEDVSFVTGSEIVKADTDEGHYVDYKFYVRLSDTVADTYLYLSSLTITETANKDLAKAARVAVIKGDALVGIYGVDKDDTTTGIKAVTAVDGTLDTNETKTHEMSNNPTEATNAIQATYNAPSANTDASAVLLSTNATELTVRVWIEGQDANCINTNAAATLNVEIEFSVVEL